MRIISLKLDKYDVFCRMLSICFSFSSHCEQNIASEKRIEVEYAALTHIISFQFMISN